MSEWRKLGQLLINEGLIDEVQLRAALGEQARWGRRLGETLVSLGLVTEHDLVRTLTQQYGVPGVDLAGKSIDPRVIQVLPAEVAHRHLCLPLFMKREGGVEILYLGMDDPSDLAAVDDVSFRTGFGVRPVVASPVQLRAAIEQHYGELPAGGSEGARLSETSVIREAPVRSGDTAPVLPPRPESLDFEPTPDELSGLEDRDPPSSHGAEVGPLEDVLDFESTPEPGSAPPIAPRAETAPWSLGEEESIEFDITPEERITSDDAMGAPLEELDAAETGGGSLGVDDAKEPFPVPVAAAPAAVPTEELPSPEGVVPPAPDGEAVVGQAPAASAATEVPEVAKAASSAPVRPRDVPTRDILQAVTRLLIDKGIFSRAELMEAVQSITASDEACQR